MQQPIFQPISQLLILDAADRQIRSMGLEPDKVSSEQVINGIERLKEKKREIQRKYRGLSQELSEKEKQLNLMREYIDKNAIGQSRSDHHQGEIR